METQAPGLIPEAAEALLADFTQRHQLPPTFRDDARNCYWPLAERLLALSSASHETQVIGINGCQGSGKSTLAALLQCWFQDHWRLPCALLSLDDLYLDHQQRQQLAHDVHPLLATRGVPGTHRVDLGLKIISTLRKAASTAETALPRFDKSNDNPYPEALWPRWQGRPALILFEGWCVGASPQPAAELVVPVNSLEQTEDPDGRWRRYVNRQLSQVYAPLFQTLDYLVMLQAPDFGSVLKWRWRAEQRLPLNGSGRRMTRAQLNRFVQHYERLTRHQLTHLPQAADALLQLDKQHRITTCRLS